MASIISKKYHEQQSYITSEASFSFVLFCIFMSSIVTISKKYFENDLTLLESIVSGHL